MATAEAKMQKKSKAKKEDYIEMAEMSGVDEEASEEGFADFAPPARLTP